MTPDFLPLACCLSDPAHLLQPETEADPLWRRLHQLAHQKLQRWGGQLRLQPRRDRPGREILDWRELSLRIPPVILAGAVAPLRHIRLLDPSIAPPVPVAQLHVHLGNGFFFELLWSHRASRMIWDHPDEKPLPPPPALFSDLPFRHAASKEARWNTLLKLGFLLRAELDARCKDRPSPFGQPPSAATLRAWIAGIFQGELPLRHLRPAGLWLRDRPRPYPEHREIQSIWEQDPCYDGEACPEVGLLHRCFQKLLTGQADADFPDLFGCYLRILGLAYRGVTSDPEVAGLDAF
ncbi:MAG TPA: hypothetical protein PKW90_16855, partial [Myxococcota bacterium]|nr:hypothetical protein [Myxococcota bacterium]